VALKGPNVLQAFVLMGCGVLMFVFSCFGGSLGLMSLGAVAFVIGALGVIFLIIWGLVEEFLDRHRGNRGRWL
jgi:hypothetical protein